MLHLPNELLAAIASLLETERDINALVLTRRRLYDSLNSTLYRRNAEDSDGSALAWAVIHRREETVIKAIGAGAPGGEALWLSVRNGDEKTTRLILSSENVDGNFQDKWLGETALVAAVNTRDETLLRLLLSSGKVKVDLGDRAGRTPLFHAVDIGHDSAVKLLLDSGQSEMRRGDCDAYNVLERAIMGGNAPVVKLLMEYANIAADSPVLQGRTPLHRAMYWEQESVAQTMLGLGEVDINTEDDEGMSPFLMAALKGFTAIVKSFLDSGKAAADAHDHGNNSALMLAIAGGHEDMALMLLERGGVDVNQRSFSGHRALSLAAVGGRHDLAKTLIGMENVEVDFKDIDGKTPLTWAAGAGHLSIVELLLNTGRVDPDTRMDNGYTPFILASIEGHEHVMRCLVDTGKIDVCARANDGVTAFTSALELGELSVLELVVESGESRFDQRVEGEEGRTSLICAVHGNSVPVVEYLLNSGKIDINDWDDWGRTALHYACSLNFRDIIECLLRREDIDANARDARGLTPLLLIAGKPWGVPTIKLLIQSGKVDVSLKGYDGTTAISIATNERRYRNIKLLTEWDRRNESSNDRRTRPRPNHDRPNKVFAAEDYNVGWICALSVERAAAEAMLDQIHEPLVTPLLDTNCYTLGNIGTHNIVIACLPSGHYGTNNAVAVATNMSRSFPSINIRLMVGIGGGSPTREADVRLGDVVVGEQVIQYDMGKTLPDGFDRTALPTRPPQELSTAITKLRARHSRTHSHVPEILSEMIQRFPKMTDHARPMVEDRLFKSSYAHVISTSDCARCSKGELQVRSPRIPEGFKIHYGKIASGNQVIKDASARDRLSSELGTVCFEMEAAGLMDGFPCLVIRGICDYSDSHKNKVWQPHASAVAASYAAELLSVIPDNKSLQEPKSSEDRTSYLLNLLDFEERDSRHDTIKVAHARTCKWFLKHPYYIDWLNASKFQEHHGFLWINGKPGAGKSTLMKFCFNQAKRDWNSAPETMVISFFFNARGGDLEKTTEGMYRSLLYQILQKFHDLYPLFDALGSPSVNLTIEALQDTFGRIVQSLGHQRLVCYIDALDECDEDQIRSMVEYFDQLGKLASQTSKKLHICFSSRHYPYITIENGQKLILEDQPGHADDLERYVRGKLKAGKGKAAEDVIAKILAKSAGVFMWVVLVINILNKEYERGRIFAVKRRLQELPAELSKLFKDILTKDRHNMDDLLLCIQWILYSMRPLRCEEFYFALVSGLDPTESLVEWDQSTTTHEDMYRFLLSSSKGLAELSKSKYNRTVQFIHESVRDYLIKENGIRDLWGDRWQNFAASSHDRLKECCYQYMKVNIEPTIEGRLAPDNSEPKKDRKELGAQILIKFPFLEYATSHLLCHAEAASPVILEFDFVRNFQVNIKSWVRRHNLFAKYENRLHGLDTRPMCVFAENNFSELFRIGIELGLEVGGSLLLAAARGHEHVVSLLLELPNVDFNARTKSGQTALSLAAEKGHAHTVQSLLQKEGLDVNMANTFGRTPLVLAVLGGHETIVKRLLELPDIDINARDRNQESALNLSLRERESSIAELLLTNNATIDVNQMDKGGHSPLSRAIMYDSKAVAKLLLASPAIDVNQMDKGGHSPLSRAAMYNSKAVAKLLLASPAIDVNFIDRMGYTALSHAAMYNSKAVAELLLASPAVDVNFIDPTGSTALCRAAKQDSTVIAKLLLANPLIDVNRTDSDGNTALELAAICDSKAVAGLLLANPSVDANHVHSSGNTALSYAVASGSKAIVELLLANPSVDVNHRGQNGPVALFLAAEKAQNDIFELLLAHPSTHVNINGWKDMVELLLVNPSNDINSKYNQGQTLLCWVTRNNHKAVVELLVAAPEIDLTETPSLCYAAANNYKYIVELILGNPSININCKDNRDRTALSWSAEKGYTAITELLVTRQDIDINCKEKYFYRTPLSYAAAYGHKDIVELLLGDPSIEINNKDFFGQTPLSIAAEKGHKSIISLLLTSKSLDTNSKDDSQRTPLDWG
ncbi:unnamed protein product [Clonostachys rosea]|uniref:Nucleoside phosphorylase domain-containing protein n=1 Tax=Bionectria ochroleuca TaxID=29856 RepID=A0ABY6UUQ4_BIOOC|nr:unnamed protein product [Clonostachys rosea]